MTSVEEEEHTTVLQFGQFREKLCLTFEYLYQFDDEHVSSEYELAVVQDDGEVLLLIEADGRQPDFFWVEGGGYA